MSRLEGASNVIMALRARRDVYASRFSRALYAGGQHIMKEADKTVPYDSAPDTVRDPDKPHMRDEAFVRPAGSGFQTVVTAGYLAPYAVWVHEDLSKLHGEAFNQKYAAEIIAGKEGLRRPEEEAKWFENTIDTVVNDKSLITVINVIMRSTVGAAYASTIGGTGGDQQGVKEYPEPYFSERSPTRF